MAKLIKIVLVLVVVLGILLVMNLGSGLKKIVETLGPAMTQSEVSLRRAKISPFSGEGSFYDLVIGNPQGFDTPQAFSLGEISFSLNSESLATDIIIVESLRIVAPEVTMESARGGSNLGRIEYNIASFLDTGGQESTEAGKKIVIKDLLISDGKLKYALVGDKTLELPLPELHLTNIGEAGQGLSMAEASAKIITAISKGASKTALNTGVLKDIGDDLEGQFKDKASKIKGLLKGFKSP
jgi:uncharacterized protein involved in outer membrane biogenesis